MAAFLLLAIAQRLLFICHRLSFRQHALVKYAGNENASRLLAEKHNVLTLFCPAQARANVIAWAAGQRTVREPLAAAFEVVEITNSLFHAPFTQCIRTDVQEVQLADAGKSELSHQLALLGELQFPPDPIERVAPGNPTGVAFINSRSQRIELRLILPFLALQGSQSRADNLTGIFEPAALDLG